LRASETIQNPGLEVIEQAKIPRQGANPMKVKTNTKAGSALWGS
jgi:hypothetical protein